ncbi:cyclic-di-AMP-binding protein CbpB [Jeotgalibacillus proteolyticus]|uniref:CBS domain-containing protein n=1 Tax=Jeotgalibacillus proteolyticus TaxID=2082395 RepID=A0A2S5GGV8_9BACL|nr:cyclic-di-AMP-binding protein CbpB [Jeotgalibacillus proteolyticus]PPA72216.1 CBS domain-containing protein [Jeotgalibacillus proteolyticus]
MISIDHKDFLETSIKEFVIPSEKIAHVQPGNTIEHALLLLTKSGYSAIPVLDMDYRLKGLISTQMITDSILGLEKIEFERLDEKRVDEVMEKDIPHLKMTDQFQYALNLLVDHPFLCVMGKDGYFQGIMTRRVMLKQLQRHIHMQIQRT